MFDKLKKGATDAATKANDKLKATKNDVNNSLEQFEIICPWSNCEKRQIAPAFPDPKNAETKTFKCSGCNEVLKNPTKNERALFRANTKSAEKAEVVGKKLKGAFQKVKKLAKNNKETPEEIQLEVTVPKTIPENLKVVVYYEGIAYLATIPQDLSPGTKFTATINLEDDKAPPQSKQAVIFMAKPAVQVAQSAPTSTQDSQPPPPPHTN